MFDMVSVYSFYSLIPYYKSMQDPKGVVATKEWKHDVVYDNCGSISQWEKAILASYIHHSHQLYFPRVDSTI